MTKSDHKSDHKKKHCKDEVYDFVVVGAGNAGCVIANRLSESGKFSVCVLEYGRDDAKLPELLPETSPAPVPQPGDFHWGKYVRGAPAPTEFPGSILTRGFGHFDWFQREDANGPAPFRSTTYARHSGWGGCTSHNFTFSIRNPPYAWDHWVALGLTEWDATLPTSNLIQYYKKVENRSQRITPTVPFYDKGKFNTADPLGPQPLGSFPPSTAPQYYGFNGRVPMLHFGEVFLGVNPFTTVMQNAVGTVLAAFNYPSESPGVAQLVDIDWPPAAHLGGLSYNNWSQIFQFGLLTPPSNFFDLPQNQTTYETYSKKLFPDEPIFVYPPEFEKVGLTGPLPTVRASSATTYLYSALQNKNLTVKSEVLATKVIIHDNKARGVKYLEGWNIYQTGRNNDAGFAGYGGSRGDAKANAAVAKQKGERCVFARKEVILCAGVYNTPQILQLSGVGNADELRSLGIKVKHNLPGVGEHLLDNQELFLYWDGINPQTIITLAAKSNLSINPNFELAYGLLSAFANESRDVFVQKRWVGTKNIPAIYQSFVRNDFNNILVDTNINPADPKDVPFLPIMRDFNATNALLVEQEDNNRTEGSVKIVSTDPTVPPEIIFNYLQNPDDLQDWLDIMNNAVFPILLYLKANAPQYFSGLLDPAPVDFLKPGVTYFNWTDMSQVDQDRLKNFLFQRVGGHHACGSCKMGLESDPLAVVDQKGRVYGVKNLRICDASICPVTVRWPNITLYVVGEKIAADILAEHC